jgi:hypothetical protein
MKRVANERRSRSGNFQGDFQPKFSFRNAVRRCRFAAAKEFAKQTADGKLFFAVVSGIEPQAKVSGPEKGIDPEELNMVTH